MATSIPMLASMPPAKAAAPSPSSSANSAGSTGMAGGASAQENKPFSSVLSAESQNSAPPESEAQPTDSDTPRDAAGGELPPQTGNELPLVLILPPVNQPAGQPVPVAEAVAETVISAGQQPAAPTYPVVAAPPADTAEAGAIDLANVVPDDAGNSEVPEAFLSKVANAMNGAQTSAEETGMPPLPPSVAERTNNAAQPVQHHAVRPAAHQQSVQTAVTQTSSAPAPAVATVAAQVTVSGESESGSEDPALRQPLEALSGVDVRKTNPHAVEGSRAIPSAATRAPSDAAMLSAANTLEGMAERARGLDNDSTRQLLREVGFERASNNASPTAAMTPAAAPLQQAGQADSADTAQLQLPIHMQRPEWAENLGERIVWMTDRNLSNAQIRLNPAHLGPLDVQVTVTDDQTNVVFSAHNAATREALEAAAPRLREMLNAQGMTNVNVNINHQSASDRPTQNHSYQAQRSFDIPTPEFSSSGSSTPTRQVSARTLIDAYA